MLAVKACASELASYAFLYYMTAHVDARASGCALFFPLLFMRIALMVGNWGQHALVDEIEPDHDLRSSITLIDVTVSHKQPHTQYIIADTLNRATDYVSTTATIHPTI